MGKKSRKLKKHYTWSPIEKYNQVIDHYFMGCFSDKVREFYAPEYVLVKLLNGYISRGIQDGTGLWHVYDYDNKMRIVSLENPVTEWCWMPMEST